MNNDMSDMPKCKDVELIKRHHSSNNLAFPVLNESNDMSNFTVSSNGSIDNETAKTDEERESNINEIINGSLQATQYEHEPPRDDYDDDRSELGRGTYGVTSRMKNRVDGSLYAVKAIIVKQAEMERISRNMLTEEATLLQKLNHPNIVRYYTNFYSMKGKRFNVVMELITGGTMAAKIVDSSVDRNTISIWWAQLSNALYYMHYKAKIQHRDIKPENIMITESNDIKIIDFGMAAMLRSNASKVTKVGTTTYYSYEKACDIAYDARDDVWAAGCVMAELLTKSRLTDRGGAICMFQNAVVNDRRERLISDCESFDTIYGSIIARMLEPEQRNRCTSEELVILIRNGCVSPISSPSKMTDKKSVFGVASRVVEELTEYYDVKHSYKFNPPMDDHNDCRAVLGQGTFGATYRMSKPNGQLFAVKMIEIKAIEEKCITIEELMQEANSLVEVNHPHVAMYMPYFIDKKFQIFHLVMEFVSGESIANKIKDDTILLESKILWLTQLASVLFYLHFEANIQHRDIKPENLLITSCNHIKVIDIGMPCIVKSRASIHSRLDTLTYSSFEKATGLVYDGRDDVWAAGCVIAELLTKNRLHTLGGAIYLNTTSTRMQLIGDCIKVDVSYGAVIKQMLEPLQENRCNSLQLLELIECASVGYEELVAKLERLIQNRKPNYENMELRELVPIADGGDVNAQFLVGKKYNSGIDMYKNIAEAVRYSKMAADNGHCDAQIFVARCYHNGDGIEKNLSESCRYWTLAADQGNAIAQSAAGSCHAIGIGVPVNSEVAFKYFQLAANKKNYKGQCNLGCCYSYGIGVEVNVFEAFKYFKMSADQNNTTAMFEVGRCYEFGVGVERNVELARYYFTKAYKTGYTQALYNTRASTAFGLGMEKNTEEAVESFKKYFEYNQTQSNPSHVKLLFDLGLMFVTGSVGEFKEYVNVNSIDSDLKKLCGRNLFHYAAQNGSEEAEYYLANKEI